MFELVADKDKRRWVGLRNRFSGTQVDISTENWTVSAVSLHKNWGIKAAVKAGKMSIAATTLFPKDELKKERFQPESLKRVRFPTNQSSPKPTGTASAKKRARDPDAEAAEATPARRVKRDSQSPADSPPPTGDGR
eukprot:6484273-Amphidinium_carterae.1